MYRVTLPLGLRRPVVDALRQREVHHRPGNGREHLDEGVGLSHDCETDNAQRRGKLEEALDHAGEVVRTADGVRLCGGGFHSEQAQDDDDEQACLGSRLDAVGWLSARFEAVSEGVLSCDIAGYSSASSTSALRSA